MGINKLNLSRVGYIVFEITLLWIKIILKAP